MRIFDRMVIAALLVLVLALAWVADRGPGRAGKRDARPAGATASTGWLSAADYGAIPNDGLDDTVALRAWAAALGNNSAGIIPPGEYSVNGTVGFFGSNMTITAHGAKIVQTALDAVTFDLNARALPDESVVTHNVRWMGGVVTSSTPGTENRNVGIRVAGITRALVAQVHGTRLGGAFIEASPRDALRIEDVHGYQNGIQVHIPNWLEHAGNPQIMQIVSCGFSIHYEAGIKADKAVQDLLVQGCYFTGRDAIVLKAGPKAHSSTINIIANSFEQAKGGEFYIRVLDDGQWGIFNLNILESNFNNPDARPLYAETVRGLHFERNAVVSDLDGSIAIGRMSRDIHVRENVWIRANKIKGNAVSFEGNPAELLVSDAAILR